MGSLFPPVMYSEYVSTNHKEKESGVKIQLVELNDAAKQIQQHESHIMTKTTTSFVMKSS